LNMPKDCLNLGPHCHPGGELAIVTDGCYFDAHIDGSKIWEYPKGSVVFYKQWSTHRPLSDQGAQITYFTFDGLIIPNRGVMSPEVPRKVLEKMSELKAPKDAVDYALEWMIQSADERERLLAALFSY
ncbi:MAG: hypothetical protein Q7R96_02075, partial [Nanoarchaeota archaeon]|nr:hypothetical protein [Nanoarchaeota archaeon]